MKQMLLLIGLVLPLTFANTLSAKAPKNQPTDEVTANEVEPLCGPLTQGYQFKLWSLKTDIENQKINLSNSDFDQRIEELVNFKMQLQEACSEK